MPPFGLLYFSIDRRASNSTPSPTPDPDDCAVREINTHDAPLAVRKYLGYVDHEAFEAVTTAKPNGLSNTINPNKPLRHIMTTTRNLRMQLSIPILP